MQFVLNGPDVPERLLQLHEDGRVVFFCGAGISYPARLPGFKGLVSRLYQALSVTPDLVQESAIKAGQFDTAIGLLESDVVDGRASVRRALAKVLSPDLTAPNATTTHEALLTLAKNREGRTRLITTNFDRLFEEVRTAKALSFPDFKAPLLPVPKARWDGLVYLHGLLPATPTPAASDLDRLVASSGDFGLAYLTERWAARFVSELFRNFTVCFVGYSINDPVLRYMMDALAADRLLGESPPEIFAFGSYSKGQETKRANEWKAKNVTPILYREHRHHAYLHKTLHAWATTYRDGVRGKEQIVVQSARFPPLTNTQQDDFIGRMLWALSDPSGLPAKRFAQLSPAPSLDWLKPLSEPRYRHADLGRFGVPAHTAVDNTLNYSLTHRPTPYSLAPWMALVDSGRRHGKWDMVMEHLANWLVRHLDNPSLLLWVIQQGGGLHEQLARRIERHFDELADIAHNGNSTELDRIRSEAPNAIPRPDMRTLWRLLLGGHVKSGQGPDFYSWSKQFQQEGLTASTRLALRELLKPRLLLREPLRWPDEGDGVEAQDCIKEIVEWELVLASGSSIRSYLPGLSKSEQWTAALPDLLDDFNILLRDALDLMRELDNADSRKNDRSHLHLSSIAAHPQNRHSRIWTVLIELTRDAWLETAKKTSDRARIVATTWAHGPYPLFRRLALFAASQEHIIPIRQALDWLLADGHWWLWSPNTKREAMRLLVSLAPQLDAMMLEELEQAILAGPPRSMYRVGIEPDAWSQIVDRSVWLRLAKLLHAGATLCANGQARLTAIEAQNRWQLAEDERDEFPFWMGGVFVGDHAPWKSTLVTPRKIREVSKYLQAHPVLQDSEQDNWRALCSERFLATAYALCKLAQQNNWPVERWRSALQAWEEEKLRDRSWRFMAPLVANAPDNWIQALSHDISWWLKAVAETSHGHEDHFLALARRTLHLEFKHDSSTSAPIFQAISHPIGRVTQALLNWWYRQELQNAQGLPDSIEGIFTELCDTRVTQFRHGRGLLAANAPALFRVDEVWTRQHLLTLLDWSCCETEAQAAWQGFLQSPRLYHPLMEAIKPAFLDTARHYAQLGQLGEQFAAFLTFAALNPGDTFTAKELATAFNALPAEALHASAQALADALESTGEQREDYWKNRILPFWTEIWPKSQAQATHTNAKPLARLCIAANGEFPSAVAAIGPWLRPIQYLDYIARLLHEAELPKRFPEHALIFLHAIVNESSSALQPSLSQCLTAIQQAEPALQQDHRFMKLDELARRIGY